MDRATYEAMAKSEQHHWWYVGRRLIIARLIQTYGVDRVGATDKAQSVVSPLKILEAGCGSGGNLDMLSRHGTVDAFEYDDTARKIAAMRGCATVTKGMLPADIPQSDRIYDIIGLFDVLEHIDDDRATLVALKKNLNAEGRLIMTVPAMPWLWSDHDLRHHHKRRYVKRSLVRTIEASGLRCLRVGYFNSLLFPVGAMRRLFKYWGDNDDVIPFAPLNFALKMVFCSEQYYVPHVAFPFGMSLYAVACR